MINHPIKLVAILLLLVTAGVISWNSFFTVYAAKDTVNIHTFPKIINDWTSEELEISDEEYAILETKNAFSRMYKNPSGKQTMLFIVYSQNNRKVSHPPELCYSGSGLTLVGHTQENIALQDTPFKVNKLLFDFSGSNYKQVVLYWFKVGDSFTDSYWKQQLLIAAKTLLNQPASSALIRLSATVDQRGQEEATKNLKEFASQIYASVKKHLP